jgi:hypothetical protein
MTPKWKPIYLENLQLALSINTFNSDGTMQQESAAYVKHIVEIGALNPNRTSHPPSVRKAMLVNDLAQDIHQQIASSLQEAEQLGPQLSDLARKLAQLCQRACIPAPDSTDDREVDLSEIPTEGPVPSNPPPTVVEDLGIQTVVDLDAWISQRAVNQ